MTLWSPSGNFVKHYWMSEWVNGQMNNRCVCEGHFSIWCMFPMISSNVLTKNCSDFQNSLVTWTRWWGLWPSTAAWPILSATFAKDYVGCASMPICCSWCRPISDITTHYSTSASTLMVTGGSPLIWESYLWFSLFLCFFGYLWKTEIIVSGHYNLRAVYVLLVIFQHFICISHMPPFILYFVECPHCCKSTLPETNNGKYLCWWKIPEKSNKQFYTCMRAYTRGPEKIFSKLCA